MSLVGTPSLGEAWGSSFVGVLSTVLTPSRRPPGPSAKLAEEGR